ncbi:MAG: hypothetical protein HOK14_05830 [Gammaproteobacteria bacterium]|nr:hypothetical protein [Gammaproteobacteria bacterium]MBT6419840.1 hypothetical protein [Gammaproteobacteria bacterium]MBT7435285.1 hypothetical protein [Gammaproteobacteria bacterium]
MEKTPAALTLLIAATLMGCTSTEKKTTDSDAKNERKQTCTSNTTNKPIAVAHDIAFTTADTSDPHHKHSVQTGRYSAIKTGPTHEQSSLLDVMITVTIPNSIQTIGETVKYLLKRSGYKMLPKSIQGQNVSQLLSKPLPSVHRKIGPMKLIEALNMLTGPAFVLVDNLEKREIRYRLKSKYHPGVAG